jgi:hypothetical protein
LPAETPFMLALILAAALLIPYPQVPASADMVPPDDCARYFKNACDYWKLATWLPGLEAGAHATGVSSLDGFVFDGHYPHDTSFAETQGSPISGTRFTYGKAGPPKGVAIYDARDHIAFYGLGCCSWHAAVLAAGVAPPPLPIMERPLSGVHTARGLSLGMTMQQAVHIYGHATPDQVKGVPGVSVLSYHHAIPPRPPSTYMECVQYATLGFYRDRLIYIGFYNGC